MTGDRIEKLRAVLHRYGKPFTVWAEREIALAALQANGCSDGMASGWIPDPRRVIRAHCGYTRAVRTKRRGLQCPRMNERRDCVTASGDQTDSGSPIPTGGEQLRAVRAESHGDNCVPVKPGLFQRRRLAP